MALSDKENLEGIEQTYKDTFGRWSYRRFERGVRKMHRRRTRLWPWEAIAIKLNRWSAVKPWLREVRFAGRLMTALAAAIAVLAVLIVIVIYVLPRTLSGGPGPSTGSSITTNTGAYYGTGFSFP